MNSINFKMWRHALTTIPQVTIEEWKQLDLVSKYLVSTRSSVIIMTAISCVIGGIMAYQSGSFIITNFLIAFVGLAFAHAANNLINDLMDSVKGIDKDNYFRAQYGPQTLEHGMLSKKSLYLYITFSLVIALACGIFLVWQTGTTTLYLLLIGLFFVIFYTWPLKYIALGEVTVIAVWGPLMVGGTYFVTTGGEWSWAVVTLGLIYALGPTSVIFGKHIDKAPEDIKKKVYTLPALLGETASRYITIIMWVAQYALLAWLVFDGFLSPAIAVVLLAIPLFIQSVKFFNRPRPTEKPEGKMGLAWPLYFVRVAFVYNKRFGLLLLLGLFLHLAVVRFGIF